jgi:hypothetical protein
MSNFTIKLNKNVVRNISTLKNENKFHIESPDEIPTAIQEVMSELSAKLDSSLYDLPIIIKAVVNSQLSNLVREHRLNEDFIASKVKEAKMNSTSNTRDSVISTVNKAGVVMLVNVRALLPALGILG